MDSDSGNDSPRRRLSGSPTSTPRPTHPWAASIALVVGVVVLIIALAVWSTF